MSFEMDALRAAATDFRAGRLLMIDVLARAEAAHRAPPAVPARATVVVATLPGDVHDIGRALLVAILGNAGYRVVDLGTQVPIERVVAAAAQADVGAVALSALLLSDSTRIRACIAALDQRGLRVPVLLGGAAITRAAAERAAILPDGRAYGVFYCRDVIEGLATLDALLAPERKEASSSPLVERGARVEAASPGVARSALGPGPAVTPPFWGARRVPTRLADVWPLLDLNTLFRFHWGGYRLPPDPYARLVGDVFEPELARLKADAEANHWLAPGVVTGYFPTNAGADELIVADPTNPARELVRLVFPRQPGGERLCLSDYFRPVASGPRDVLALQAVTVGPGAAREVERALRAGAYRRMWYVNGLAGATAEALAAHAHQQTRAALGLGAAQGLRFSWGYAACPDLAEQRKVLPLLDAAAAIGVRLSDSNTLDPEHSTVALIVQHPAAKYFGLHPG